MAFSINIPPVPYSRQQVTLGSQPYIVIIEYRERTKRYYLTLKTSTGITLLTGKKIVGGELLTALFELGMDGEIGCFRNFGKGDYPTWDTLGPGKEFELQYLTQEEIEIMRQYTAEGTPSNDDIARQGIKEVV